MLKPIRYTKLPGSVPGARAGVRLADSEPQAERSEPQRVADGNVANGAPSIPPPRSADSGSTHYVPESAAARTGMNPPRTPRRKLLLRGFELQVVGGALVF